MADIAVITGASRGIGRACALALAGGFDLALHYHANTAAMESLVAELKTQTVRRVQAFSADLAHRGAAEALIDKIAGEFGSPTVLVHAAGQIIEKPLAMTKPEEWDAQFELHAFSAAALAKTGLRYLRKSAHGRIVFIGSLAGTLGLGNAAAYAAAKGALNGLCKSLALEAARWQTTVNVVAPGYVETDLTAHHDAEQREALSKTIPLGRYAQASEVAALVAFLCSPSAGYLTGQTLLLDGGLSLG